MHGESTGYASIQVRQLDHGLGNVEEISFDSVQIVDALRKVLGPRVQEEGIDGRLNRSIRCGCAPRLLIGFAHRLPKPTTVADSLIRPSYCMRDAKTADSLLEVRGFVVAGARYLT
jgi:hypothetical protein